MSTIEERVVSMKFQGDQFLAGIDKSLAKLEQFNSKIKTTGGAGLDKVEASAQRLGHGGMNAIAEGVQHVSDRFKTMGVVGMSALSNITNQAIFAGQNLIKSLTIAPIMDGFHEYETNMNSIQTILANTQASGTKLKDVTAALDDLNHYSDQTIYNFSEMAKNIGTFTAAGVGLKPAASAIKGIANLAALSGSNSQQASGAMYQLSQAISSGRVSLEDWNSVVNAGMGGTVFQRALAQNAEKMGTLSKGAVKLTGDMKNVSIGGKSFRESITAKPGQESWLTSKVLTQTLAQFTGDLSNAELAVMGFNKTEIAAIQKQAATAKNAATEVKTMSQLLGTLKESVGSGWAQTWKTIFGDFEGAKKLFTGVNNVLGGFVKSSADARNKVLGDWAKMGGRTALIQGIGNAFKALVSVVKPIKDAFREAFPKTTAQDLARISFIIRNFTANLAVSGTTANKIKRTFAGFFAVIGIGWDILKQFIGLIGRLTGVAFEGGGGFLDFAAKVGDFLVNLRQAIKEGKGVENFFKGIGDWLEIPIRAIKLFGQSLSAAFDKIGGDKVIATVEKISAKTEPMAHQAEKIATGWEKVKGTLGAIWDKISAIGGWIVSKFAGLGSVVGEFFSGFNFDDITKGINTGLFGGLVLMFKGWLGGGAGGGIMDNLNESIQSLTKTLGAMQQALRAAALLEIALAIGILAISLNVLSKIDAAGLAQGTTAMAGLFAQLVGASILLDKFTTFKGAAKLPLVAASMILMGAAILILTLAMKQLAGLSWEEIAKGLTGVTILMAEMIAMMRLMPSNAKFLSAAISMVLLSFGIRNIASAVQTLGSMSWEDMARGLLGVGFLMGAILLFINNTKVSAGGAVKGAVIYLMAAAISTLADSVKKMSGLSWEEMSRGLAMTSAGLGLITAALRAIPKGALISAISIFVAAQAISVINDVFMKGASLSWESIGKGMAVMGGSLALLAIALKKMAGPDILAGAGALAIASGSLQLLSVSLAANAKLSWEEIGKGMVVMAGSLILLAVAMKVMEKNMTGAQALITAAGALSLIGGVMVALGGLSWTQVAIGLTALAGVFLILGLAALILQPVIPALYSLAIAVAMIGIAMLAAGAGVALFGLGILLLAMGFAALAVAGVAGATALIGMISVIIGGLPVILELIGKLLIGLLQLVIDAVPKITEAAVAIMLGFLDGIRQVVPVIIEVVLFLLLSLVEKLASYVPRIADAALRLMTGFLNAIAGRIGAVINAAANLIVAFLDGLAKELPRIAKSATNLITTFIKEVGKSANKIADAGMKMIVDFVNGLAESIRTHSKEMRSAGENLAMAIIDGMTGGLGSGIGKLVSKAKEMAGSVLNAARKVLDSHSPSREFIKLGNYVNDGFRIGLDGNRGQIDSAFNSLKSQLSAAMKDSKKDVDSLTAKLKKLTHARHRDNKAIAATKAALAQAKKEYIGEIRAQYQLTKALNDKHSQLGKLATQQDQIAAKLESANKTLDDAIKTRDDYNKSIADQYDNLPDLSGEDTTLASYVANLRKQIEDTQVFASAIQKLRSLGLNDELYKELLSKGPSALPFINDVLASGQAGVDELNKLGKELDITASGLGFDASSALYQAGVDAALGLVEGLKQQQAAIEAQMDKIAAAMIASIKKALGIKSPSREFMKVGGFSIEGLTKGLETASPRIEKASAKVGARAIESLRASLSSMPDILSNIDTQPTIRPVLDLSDVRRGVGSIGKMMPGHRISVGAAYSNAKDASAGYQANKDFEATGALASHTELTYIQNNNSPKALSSAEIYRQTNNQLSRTKGALASANPGRS